MNSNNQLDQDRHNAIEKALSILGLYAFDNQELGTIEISKILGYHKATTSRTLITLAEYGFLEQNEVTKKYKLGSRIVSLGLSISRTLKNDLVQIAKPYLEKLRNTIQETIILEILSGKRIITGYIADGPSNIQLGGRVGETMPSTVTAGAKAILAFSPQLEWDEFLETELPRQTPNSITDPDQFRKQLVQITKTGIATDYGENDLELYAISAPIFNIEGRPIASVDAIGLANRIDISIESKTAQELKKTARAISKRLYYSDKKTDSLNDWLASLKL